MPDALEQRLGDLAGDLAVPVPDGLEDAVMARVAAVRPRRRFHRWVAGLLLGSARRRGRGVAGRGVAARVARPARRDRVSPGDR